MSTKLDLRQSVLRSTLGMVGSSINDTADTLFPKIDSELAKLFEDRNIQLADGGLITFVAAGTSVTFTQALKLHINSQVAGGAPTVIDLASTTRALSANLRMIYAVIDRSLGTATITADSATLPAQTSANQEIVLIAKRVDSADGTKVVHFRGGFSLSAGQTSRLGMSAYMYASEFAVIDSTDTTKKIAMSASGSAASKTLTLASAITDNRTVTFPDATDTLVGLATTDVLTNKTLQFLRQAVTNDAASTGSSVTLAAITTGVVRLTNASLVSISGIPAGISGQSLTIENKTGVQITINNDDAAASAADRVYTGTGANVVVPSNATLVFTYDSTSSRWMLTGGSGSGSGGSGTKNYLTTYLNNPGNGDFEAATTTGWSKYNSTLDSTTKLPNQASGSWTSASANLAFTAVTSGKLAGSYSGQIQQSSGNSVAGDMIVSDAFTIDTEDQNKVLAFKFYYSLTAGSANVNFSGTSSNSFGVAFYDVTNSVWIQPAGVFNLVQNSGVGICTGSFQTDGSATQYRMAVYFPNASTGTFTLLVDDFSFGPQAIPNGAAISDWVVKTMTLTNAGNATVSARMARVGDVAWFEGTITIGNSLPTGSIILNMPSGMTIDLTKSTGLAIGIAGASNSGGTGSYTGTVRINNSSTLLFYGDSNAGIWNATVPRTFADLDVISFHFPVAVTGWSSNTVMSNDTDTRVVAASYQSSVGTTMSATPAALPFATKLFDTTGSWSSDTYTVPVSGKYRVTTSLTTSSVPQTAGQGFSAYIYKNGSNHSRIGLFRSQATATYSTSISASGVVDCNAGDTLKLYAANDAGAALDGVATDNTIIIERLSGPATIAATESISARYANTAGSTINTGALTAVPFVTKVVDTHGAWDGTNKFTAPISGKYAIKANLILAGATLTTAQNFQCAVYKNGALDSYGLIVYGNGTSATYTVNASTTINLLAGEYIQLFALCNGTSTALSTATGANYICIERVGN